MQQTAYSLQMESQELERVGYWLQTISERATECPVVLVGTHLDTLTEEKVQQLTSDITTKFSFFTQVRI